ncbi:hypothetical protein PFICI_07927 [Pestalotiopsis fici W106-1]|uniref:MARVEL domain-containing protein n=1 Tax=Pestalotiopsis fici (strain W106-1 / CGMCC3.15140) TaxID=1229662 RepID=W3X2M9_PESFW|nr:uncharacterized protein PFICI_07927 [Pestalotiopsis fici W106-1]ETS80398.1 hypothetical protein PFICI_07927 [Pestalotiopsis fici W106-1]
MANDGKTVIPTPTWVLVARIFQLVLSIIVVGGAGWFIHGLYEDSLGFAIVCSLFTWIIFVYAIVTENVSTCRRAYNTWAILSLDGLMIIFWLSAMGAVAAKRADFTVPVNADCTSDGSAVNSGHCTISRKRAGVGVASYAALDIMSAVAGICAIIMLLFVATFSYVCHKFRLSWSSNDYDAEKRVGGPGNTSVAYHHPEVEMQPNMPTQYSGYPQQVAVGTTPQYSQNHPYDPYVH